MPSSRPHNSRALTLVLSLSAPSASFKDLRRIGEEVSERYEYIPAQMKIILAKPSQPIEEVCYTYACACTVKTVD